MTSPQQSGSSSSRRSPLQCASSLSSSSADSTYHTGSCTVLCGRLCDTCQCTVWAVCSPSISCCSGGDIGLPLAAGDVGQPAAFAYLTLQGPPHGIGHWVSMQAWQTLLHCNGQVTQEFPFLAWADPCDIDSKQGRQAKNRRSKSLSLVEVCSSRKASRSKKLVERSS